MNSIFYRHLERLIPEPARITLRYHEAKRRCEKYMAEKLGHYYHPVDPGTVASRELILKTAALDDKDVEQKTNPNVYFTGGYRDVLRWLRILERYSFNLRTVASVMEFGVGSARILRHFRCIDGIRLVGSDVNPRFIEWCKANVPGPEYYTNDLVPPLTFAEDNSFDLVIAQSVFTHIPLDLQRPWLEELRRILRPGGFFLCTILGGNFQKVMLNNEEMNRLHQAGHLTLTSSDANASLSTRVLGSGDMDEYWDVFQTRESVISSYGSVFRILDYIPGGLDLLVLQKPFDVPGRHG